MSDFMDRLKRATKAAFEEIGPGQFTQDDKPIRCPHCGNDHFEEGTAQLNTAGMSFLNLDWADRSATILACTRCGRIEWYLDRPERL